MTKVLITGGTGLVGTQLSTLLRSKGYEINILSRSRSGIHGGIHYYKWSVEDNFIEDGALNVDHIIHLAGASIADKAWSTARKKEILESRVQSSKLITKHLLEQNISPTSIICASAVGYYGDRHEEVLAETAQPGTGFMSDVCQAWEAASHELGAAIKVPLAILRIGIVLSSKGGALPPLSAPAKYGLGAYQGGAQFYPWIHIDDLCAMFLYSIEERLRGTYNATAPTPVRNKDLIKTIAYVLKRPFIPLPGPAWAIRFILGERAEMLLSGQKTSAQKIMDAGFKFKHPDLEKALRDIFQRGI